MLNVPQEIRNQLARLPMLHPALKAILAMESEDNADQALQKLARKMVGFSPTIQHAWMTVAPLLLENEAIDRFVRKNPDWRMTLPEILTISEALEIAQVDYLLTKGELETLAAALEKPLPENLS